MTKENKEHELKDEKNVQAVEDTLEEMAEPLSKDEADLQESKMIHNELSEEAICDCQKEIEHLQEEIQNLEDKNLRLQAEIANMQRSHTRERQDAAKYRSQFLAKNLMDAIDNLERALQIEAKSEESQAIHKGVQMVYDQIIHAFANENITVLDPLNEDFDPNFHQAVTTQPVAEGQEADKVVNVLQKGYLLNDRIIRPAMVIVSA